MVLRSTLKRKAARPSRTERRRKTQVLDVEAEGPSDGEQTGTGTLPCLGVINI